MSTNDPLLVNVTVAKEPADQAQHRPRLDFEKLTKGIAFVAGALAAGFSACTFLAGTEKFQAETTRAKIEAQQARAEAAEKSKDLKMDLKVTPLAGQGAGWHNVMAEIHRTNSGSETMVVLTTRFQCSYADMSTHWKPIDNTSDQPEHADALAIWVNTPVSGDEPGGLDWHPLGRLVTYPLGGTFHGNHPQSLSGSPYQPNGVGIYLPGETMVATHEVLAHFSATAAVGCAAEIEYITTNESRREILVNSSDPEWPPASFLRYRQPFVNTTILVCGAEGYDRCSRPLCPTTCTGAP
ncbi:MAG: hypothetical protein HOW73_18295 [Polyangiaceae bacterium]|nr:hypothetical protein [Polyangiaceae bacterium]